VPTLNWSEPPIQTTTFDAAPASRKGFSKENPTHTSKATTHSCAKQQSQTTICSSFVQTKHPARPQCRAHEQPISKQPAFGAVPSFKTSSTTTRQLLCIIIHVANKTNCRKPNATCVPVSIENSFTFTTTECRSGHVTLSSRSVRTEISWHRRDLRWTSQTSEKVAGGDILLVTACTISSCVLCVRVLFELGVETYSAGARARRFEVQGHDRPRFSSCVWCASEWEVLRVMSSVHSLRSEVQKRSELSVCIQTAICHEFLVQWWGAQKHTANSVGNASVKRRGLVHGLTIVRAAYLLSTK
jgi:hypothetical protein